MPPTHVDDRFRAVEIPGEFTAKKDHFRVALQISADDWVVSKDDYPSIEGAKRFIVENSLTSDVFIYNDQNRKVWPKAKKKK